MWAFFSICLRVGNLTFGGGDPTMAALFRELVERRGLMTREQYATAYALARVTPGTNLLAFSAACGYTLYGWLGAAAAVLAITIPSSLLVVWVTIGYQAGRVNPLVTAVVGGVIASAIGMMIASAWQLVQPRIKEGQWLRSLLVCGGAMILLSVFHITPILILLVAGLIGYFLPARETRE
jgi:chromate transporter